MAKPFIGQCAKLPLIDELKASLLDRYADLTPQDADEIVTRLRHVPGQTHFERLRNTFVLVRDGFRYTRNSDGAKFDIKFVDFDNPEKNTFRAVNQLEIGYGLRDEVRIPDVLLYVNGIPLCIFELKKSHE